jgi:hypothetical protein
VGLRAVAWWRTHLRLRAVDPMVARSPWCVSCFCSLSAACYENGPAVAPAPVLDPQWPEKRIFGVVSGAGTGAQGVQLQEWSLEYAIVSNPSLAPSPTSYQTGTVL